MVSSQDKVPYTIQIVANTCVHMGLIRCVVRTTVGESNVVRTMVHYRVPCPRVHVVFRGQFKFKAMSIRGTSTNRKDIRFFKVVIRISVGHAL